MKKLFIACIVAASWLAEAAPPADQSELTTISVTAEGRNLLADTKGNSLYVFDLDQNQKVPACSSKCAEIWPPYLVNAAEVKNLRAPLSAVLRDNKNLQLTYEGRPVYAYAYDRGPAAEDGDGVGGVWHIIELPK